MSISMGTPKKVLKNDEIIKSLPADGKTISFYNTSSFDSVTEILGHAIRQCNNVKEYFENNRDSKKAERHLCYATIVLNFAKHGPNSDAYQLRNEIFDRTMERRHLAYDLYSPLTVLKLLLRQYVDVGQGEPCHSCFNLKWSLTSKADSIHKISCMGCETLCRESEISGWMENIDKYFAEKEYSCNKCLSRMLGQTLPLLRISGAKDIVSMVQEYFFKKIVNSVIIDSLEMLPVQFTKKRCNYVLCGVIGRTSLKGKSDAHYVAYCRDADGQWNKRDSLKEETELLIQLPIVDIVQIYYMNMGCWDADERKILFEPTKLAWFEITNILLPDLCLEKIFSYLDNRQLEFFLNGAEKNDSVEAAINKLWDEKAILERMPEDLIMLQTLGSTFS